MSKSKLVFLVSAVLSIAAFCMMFLPQLTFSVVTPLHVTLDNVSAPFSSILFGGEVLFAENARTFFYKGADLAFVGYIFLGVSALLSLSSFVLGKGLGTFARIIAVVFAILGGIFVLCTCANWKELNDIYVGDTVNGYTYTNIANGIGPVVGGIVGLVAAVANVGGFFLGNK